MITFKGLTIAAIGTLMSFSVAAQQAIPLYGVLSSFCGLSSVLLPRSKAACAPVLPC